MQTVSQQFLDLAAGSVQPMSWVVKASFDKVFDPDIQFFTLGVSEYSGPDVLATQDASAITEWAKYDYKDYSSRVVSVEVTQEEVEPYSIVQQFADVVFNNFDDYFTPNSGSPIDAYILPRRPFQISMGYGGENVPQFFGMSKGMPEIDKNAGTVRFHLIDFLSFIFAKEVGETLMGFDMSTTEILQILLLDAGLTSDQFDLDPVSFNHVPFFFVEKGQNLGNVIHSLMEAEQGRLFMDEFGIIRFLNRQNYNTTPVHEFNRSNVSNYLTSGESDIINSVKVESDIYREQSNQSVWKSTEEYFLLPGQSVEIWADLPDPVTFVGSPVYTATELTSSYFMSTSDQEGTIPYADIDLTSSTTFSKAYKMTFENAGSSNGYIKIIDLWGAPIKVIDTVVVEDQDDTSVENFEEQRYELKTSYIQDRNSAISKAAIMIDDYKDFGSILELELAKGNLALEIGDAVTLDIDSYTGTYVITKIINVLNTFRAQQKVVCKQKAPRSYFVLGVSEYGGTDDIAP